MKRQDTMTYVGLAVFCTHGSVPGWGSMNVFISWKIVSISEVMCRTAILILVNTQMIKRVYVSNMVQYILKHSIKRRGMNSFTVWPLYNSEKASASHWIDVSQSRIW
jgi:hypothetical protein